jgi:hypothetical protein
MTRQRAIHASSRPSPSSRRTTEPGSIKDDFCGLKDATCHLPADPLSLKFHVLRDSTPITETFYDWGGNVDRLYDPQNGWLNSAKAHKPDLAGDSIIAWVSDTHAAAQNIWTKLLPANNMIDQNYYNAVLRILDRQLGVAGVRLAPISMRSWLQTPARLADAEESCCATSM